MQIFHQDGTPLANLSDEDFLVLKLCLQAESLNDRDRFVDESAIDILEQEQLSSDFIKALRSKMTMCLSSPQNRERDFDPSDASASTPAGKSFFSVEDELSANDPYEIPGFEIYWEK